VVLVGDKRRADDAKVNECAVSIPEFGHRSWTPLRTAPRQPFRWMKSFGKTGRALKLPIAVT